MARTRICIIGAGSYNWSPTLLQDIALTPGLTGTIVLHDIAPEPLQQIQQLGRQIMSAAEADFTLEASTDLTESLRDAEFVIVTISTGGLAAMQHDLEIPERYGIAQSVGDTVGPGGLSRALRNIPVMIEIARAMEQVCPDAWLLNLTNPLTTLTRAVTRVTTIKTIGLCHELDGVQRTLTRMFDVSDADIALQVAGINHLIWLLDLKINGQDGLQMVRDYARAGTPIPLKSTSGGPRAPFQDRWQVKLALLDAYGYLPAAGDRHVAEFFPYFLSEETQRGADFGVLLTRIEHRQEIGRDARAQVATWLDGSRPLQLERSREAIADIIVAVKTGTSLQTVVNLPNEGQIDNLPRDAVVETLGIVDPTGAHGIAVGTLPPGVLRTVHPHVINQELTVEAALTGDRQLALQALLGDPLVRDFRSAPRMLDEMLQANAAYLPQF